MSEELLNNEDNFLELSDEEIMNMDLTELTSGAEAEEGGEPSDADSGAVEEPETAETDENEDDVPEDTDDPADATDVGGDTDSGTDETEVKQDAFDGTEQEPATDVEDPTEDDESDDDASGIDYKAEYERLTAPFKANGKQIKVDSVDEAIQLMQMGANYNKKMDSLKPHLQLLKMLENNGLLEESKLSYLIDLDKKNPDAVKHLIKESGLDPLDIDTSEQTSYKPQSYTVSEREIELDTVLEDLQHTDTYSKTVDLVSNKWDEASRKIIVENPQILRVINEHMQNGIYSKIETVMEKERVLGRLKGMSDIEAYRQIGDRIFAEGGFTQAQAVETPKPTPKPKKQADPKVVNRKKAAAPTKTAPTSSGQQDFNPLAMSDDEFDKIIASKFL